MNYPLVVVNGGKTPYVGTVVSGVPMPPGVLWDPVDIIMLSRGADGTTYRAGHHILTRHPDGSAKWVLTGVSGVFPPGETKLEAAVNSAGLYDGGVRETFFPPMLPETTSGAHVRYIDQATNTEREFILDFANLANHYAVTHYATEVMMCFEWIGSITPTLGWRVFAELRRGEPGVRLEFQLENRARGRDDKGKPQIIREASIWHKQAKPNLVAPNFAWGDQFSKADAWYGDLGVAHGKECCPLKMGYNETHGVVYAAWITEETRIPQGGDYTTPAFPGDVRNPNDPQQWPESDLGDFIYEKRSVTCFIGFPIPQEHLDHPPMLVWEDCERYDAALVGGISAVEPWKDDQGNPIDKRTLQRFERRTAAAWDPDACTPGHAGNVGERITRTQFRERGGTYPTTPDKNPMYGSFNYGDMQWGDGKTGAAHYDIDHAMLYQFLRSRDFRPWREGSIALRHLRTVDFQWATDPMSETTQRQYEGLLTYEKGQQHGNYSVGNLTHTWLNGAALAYCLTGHPDYLRVMKQAAHHLVTYETLDGAPVPSSWKVGSPTHDPRDWGTPNASHRYGLNNGGSAATGYQGDWGERLMGRALEVATAVKVYVGSEVATDIDAYYLRVLGNIERIETGIWGGHGYILNRASRDGHRYDHEQGWMHGYVLRGIGYGLRYGPPEARQRFQGLYDRFYAWMLKCVIYGHKDAATGMWVPPMISGAFDESGPILTTRFGLSTGTVNTWYPWRNSVMAGNPSQAAFDTWREAVLADYSLMLNYRSPAGHHAWLLDDTGFSKYLALVQSVTFDIDKDHADFIYLLANQWSYTTDALFPNVNHCAIGADTLAQGALEFDKDGAVEAIRLAEHAQWHLQGAITHPISDIRQNASPVAWRMAQYPNAETKVNGNQLEDRYSRRLLGQLDQVADVWSEQASAMGIPKETQANPWLPEDAAELNSPRDVNGRLDMVSADPSVPGVVRVITTAVLDGRALPVFDDQ